jgi:hypothetical protein
MKRATSMRLRRAPTARAQHLANVAAVAGLVLSTGQRDDQPAGDFVREAMAS